MRLTAKKMDELWKKIEHHAYFGIAITLIVLIIISSTSHQSLRRIQKDHKSASRTREVLLNLSYFLSDLKDAEMAQRGYLLTGQDKYLAPLEYVKQGVQKHIQDLRLIAAENIGYHKMISTFELLVAHKLDELDKLIEMQQDHGTEAAKKILISSSGQQVMADIQNFIRDMDGKERAMLNLRSKNIAKRIKTDAVVKAVAILLFSVIGILIVSRINYWIIHRATAEKRKEELLNIKSDFISMVSHELRTPLKAIRESIDIVADGTAGTIAAEQKKFITIAQRNLNRLTRFINNVLDFQKLDAGRMNFDIAANDISQTIKEVHELMSPSAEKKGVNLIAQTNGQNCNIPFDRDKIIQVLINLVDNAVKYTEKGDIVISAHRDNGELIVSVADNGPGIEEKNLPRLFRKFEQIECPNSSKKVGTGLGLAISEQIIKKHNGRIWAQSQLGKGTTVKFTLPAKEQI